jgi:hypothetical protein
MCRAPLHEDLEADATDALNTAFLEWDDEPDEHDEHDANEFVVTEMEVNSMTTLESMDFNQDEQSMHDYLMLIVAFHVEHYCRVNQRCTYMGVINVCTILEQDYPRAEVGIHDLNCHYVIGLRDSSRAFRYKFGRIESITAHHVFHGMMWFVFRELIDRLDETGHMATMWSGETQFIALSAVNLLIQYVPRVRISV